MKILMVLTSHDQLGDTGKKTGFWLEEYEAFVSDRDAAFGAVGRYYRTVGPSLSSTWKTLATSSCRSMRSQQYTRRRSS
jgi:hypothetical protein